MSPLLAIFLTVLLLAINAFFVAGEFATTSSRRSQIEPLIEQGTRGSKHALYALEHVSLMLAICQLGITVASTSLGVVAEPAIAHILEEPLRRIGMPSATAHIFGFAIALAIVLILHVVLGEMVPKNISISTAHRALLILAPPLVFIGRIVRPLIHAMDSVANWFLKKFGIEPQSEVASAFTVEEVASIVELSAQEGMLDDELGLLSGTLEFSEETAGALMVATENLVTLPASVTPEDVERALAQTGYSRYPLVGEDATLMGYLHIKDVLYAEGDERYEPIPQWRIRDMARISADSEIEDALRLMQKTGAHCVEVLSVSHDVIGVLFLEDILEELVGEVRDSLQRDTTIQHHQS